MSAAEAITKWLTSAEQVTTVAETAIHAAVEHAEGVSNEMRFLGYEGIVAALVPVIQSLRTAAANITEATGQYGAATNAVAQTNSATSPQQAKGHLNDATTVIDAIRQSLATALTQTETARSQASVALEGGNPDDLTARIDAAITELTGATGNLGTATQVATEQINRLASAGKH